MSIKCVAVDLDGTLLGANGVLSDVTRRTIEKLLKRGIEVLVASGRSLKALPSAVTDIEGIRYVITSNGSAIYDLKDNVCHKVHHIKPDSVREILKVAEDEDVVFETFIEGVPYAQKEYVDNPVAYGATPQAISYIQSTRQPITDMETFILAHEGELDSLDIVVRTEDKKKELWKKLAQKVSGIHITSSVKQLIEISHENATKATGIAFLCDMLAIEENDIVAFGDADNDIEMLQLAGRGVAMGNASQSVKEIADAVTESNTEDGVAKECNRIFCLL